MTIVSTQPRSQVNSTISSHSTEPGLNLDPDRRFYKSFFFCGTSQQTSWNVFVTEPRIRLRSDCGVGCKPIAECIIPKPQCRAIYCRPALKQQEWTGRFMISGHSYGLVVLQRCSWFPWICTPLQGHCPSSERLMNSGMTMRDKRGARRKTYPAFTTSTKNPTQIALQLNPDLPVETPTKRRLGQRYYTK